MRYIPEFVDYLLEIGYAEISANANLRLNRENENYLYSSLELGGITLDDIVADDTKMQLALPVLARIERESYKNEHQNALRLYYYFVNKHWYDRWVSPKLKSTAPRARKTTNSKVKMLPVGVPEEISNWCEDRFGAVKYDLDVPEEEKIPGLTGYLCGELDHITSRSGHYVFGEDNPVFRNRRYGTWPFIPIVLSNELPYEVFHESDEYVARKIVNSDGSYETTLKILKNRDKVDRILGTYHHSGCPLDLDFHLDEVFRFEDGSIPYITIYYRNTVCADTEEYLIKLGNCLAHEYFHFVHDVFAEREFSKTSAKAKAIKEALADFFSNMYTFSQVMLSPAMERVTKGKYDAWVERFGSGWPYAYALYFHLINNNELGYTPILEDYERFGSFAKFREVFMASRVSMKDAYEILTQK